MTITAPPTDSQNRADSRADARPDTDTRTGSDTRTVSSTRTINRTVSRLDDTRHGTVVAAVLAGAKFWTRVRSVAGVVWGAIAGTLTPVGWLAIGATAIGLGVGLSFGWMEATAAGIVAAVLLVLSAPFLVGIRTYAVDLSLTHDRVVAGTDVHGSIQVVNAGNRLALPGRIDVPVGAGLVTINVPLLRRGHQYTAPVFVPARRRGVIEVGPARTVRGDPVGVLRRELTLAGSSTLFVHPVTTALPASGSGFIQDLEGEATAFIVDADMSFHDIRDYFPGDAQRNIHWKSTAKTGTLMVRQYEETRRSRTCIVADLATDGYASDDEFELAISAVGSIGVRTVRDGRTLDVVTGAVVPQFVRSSVRSIRELRTVSTRMLLDDLAGVEWETGVAGLVDTCSLAAELHPDVSVAFLVCGSQVSAQTLRSAALAFPANVAVVAVVCQLDAAPSIRTLGNIRVVQIAILDDLRHLLIRGGVA
jgi:uncharacterized protein (DUF58 family)